MIAAVLATQIATASLNGSGFSTQSPYRIGQQGEQLVGLEAFRAPRHRTAQAQIVESTAPEKEISLGFSGADDVGTNLARLREFKTWPTNWDGEGAPAPDPKALDQAIRLYSLMSSFPQAFGVALDAEARPTFYVRNSMYEGHIAVEPDHTVSFFLTTGDRLLSEYDLAFDGRSLPAELQDALDAEYTATFSAAA